MKLSKVIEWEMLQAASFRSASDPLIDISFIDGSTFDPRIVFTRAGAGGTHFDVSGVIQNDAANVPRIGYDPVTHAIQGLLMEELRTNRFINSATPATQSRAVTANPYALSFYGTGTIALSGAFVGSLVGAGAFPKRSTLLFTPTAGTLTMTVSGSVVNPQLEQNAYPTSYIPTGAATVTRSADVAVITDPMFGGHNAGTIALEGLALQNTALASNQCWLSIDDTTQNNRLQLMTKQLDSAITVQIRATGSIGAECDGPPISRPTLFKAAVAIGGQGGSQGSAFLNGTAYSPPPDINQPFPLTLTRMSIGTGPGASTGCNGFIRRVRYWPRQLFDAELIAATR